MIFGRMSRNVLWARSKMALVVSWCVNWRISRSIEVHFTCDMCDFAMCGWVRMPTAPMALVRAPRTSIVYLYIIFVCIRKCRHFFLDNL